MSDVFTMRRSWKARSSSVASKSTSRVQRAMYGDAGSCACSPPNRSTAADRSSRTRSSRCLARQRRPAELGAGQDAFRIRRGGSGQGATAPISPARNVAMSSV